MGGRAERLLLGSLLASVAACGEEPASVPAVTNVFAASAGATVVSAHRMPTAERLIDGIIEESGAAFGDDGDVGDVASADIRTARRVTATSFRILAASDGPGAPLYRRSAASFRVEADTNDDGTFETVVCDRTLNIDYARVPGNVGRHPAELDLTVRFPSVTSRGWRFSATQGLVTPADFEGPRIYEIYLMATP